MTKTKILESTKKYFYKTLSTCQEDTYRLVDHVPEVERWALKILEKYPKADKKTVLLAIWLHDISYYLDDQVADHAVKSEKMAREFLSKEGLDKETLEKVAHCIRTHRNKDVPPSTIEAKILACADSASHMTWITYMDMLSRYPIEEVYGKLERDYRDIGLLPEVKAELTDLYQAWRGILDANKKLNIK